MPALLFALDAVFSAHALQNVQFRNFDDTLILVPLDKEQRRFKLKDNTDEIFQLHPQLVVKVTKQTAKETFLGMSGVTRVTPIYSGFEFDFLSLDVELTHPDIGTSLSAYLKLLDGIPGVLYAQPNTLQIKGKHPLAMSNLETKKNGDVQSTFFEKIAALNKVTYGENTRIAIIDNGISLSHSGFKDTRVSFQYDVLAQTLDASPKYSHELHGTKVAGILFGNLPDSRLTGMAKKASLIALRQPDSWLANTILAFHLANMAEADIVLCAWRTRRLMQPVYDIVSELAEKGRDGKGTFIVFAAGNSGVRVNLHATEAGIEEAIVVGASDAAQNRLAFSNFGSTIDVNAFGLPIETTAPDEKYANFSGTSLSATIVAGYIALNLSIWPETTRADLESKLKSEFIKRN